MSDAAATGRELASPFLDDYKTVPALPQPVLLRRESPFLQELAGEDEAGDALAQLHAELLDELEDEELEDAFHALVDEAAELSSSLGLERAHDEYRERALREHLAPLGRALHSLVDAAEARADSLDGEALGEGELDELFEGLAPDAPLESPAFEMFWGGLKNKIKKVARAAKAVAKRGVALAAGPLLRAALGRLRSLIRPLLEKVLQLMLDKIPQQYRPLAVQVAQRLGIRLPAGAVPPAPVVDASASGVAAAVTPSAVEDPALGGAQPPEAAAAGGADGGEPAGEPSVPDPAELQGELDLHLTEALLAPELQEHEWREHEGESLAARDPFAELDRARERFVRELLEAEDSSEAGPIVENFLPAVMLAVRTAIRFAGRPKIVGFLGGLIAKLIGPLVGRAAAPALGRVVADLGLRTLLKAELNEEDGRAVMAETLAGVVEDTVRRLATLPSAELETPELGEALMREAFESAAAAAFPASLIRPELREAEHGGWIALPLRGRKLYRKYSRVFDVAVTPQMAGALATYGGGSLGDFLRDRLHVSVAGPVAARVHLYQAIPRTRLARIARAEAARGLGSSEASAWSQLHPLTPEAAAMLTGSPALGRPFDEEADPRQPMIGERYYFLEVANAPARPLGAQSHLHYTLDVPRGELRACLYLSEVVAQRIATGIRRNEPVPQLLAALRQAFAGPRHGGRGPGRRMRILLGGANGRRALARRGALRGVGRHVQARARAWLWQRLSELLATRASEFVATAEKPEDGVRIAIAFALPGLAAQRRALLGRAPLAAGWLPAQVPGARIALHAGARHD
jgi:hypothetical protein